MRKISVFPLICCQISHCSYPDYFLTVFLTTAIKIQAFVINMFVSLLEVLIQMSFLQSFLTTAKDIPVL